MSTLWLRMGYWYTEVSQALCSRYLQEMFRWGPKATECLKQIENGTVQVIVDEAVKTKLQNDCVMFVNSIVCNLAARFPHTQHRILIVKAVKIFDPTNVPEDGNADYGEEQLDILAIHYSSVVDQKECQLEWDMLKQCISANFRKEKLQKFALKLAVDEGMKIQYPSLSTLAEIILTFPASTAEVKRGFSLRSAFKSRIRNRHSSDHLDQLIRMRLNAADLKEFQFHQAYQNWLEARNVGLSFLNLKY